MHNITKVIMVALALFLLNACGSTSQQAPSPAIPVYPYITFEDMELMAIKSWLDEGKNRDDLVNMFIHSDATLIERRKAAEIAYGNDDNFVMQQLNEITAKLTEFNSLDSLPKYQLITDLVLNMRNYSPEANTLPLGRYSFTEKSGKEISYRADKFKQIAIVTKDMSYTYGKYYIDLTNYGLSATPPQIEANLLSIGTKNKLKLKVAINFSLKKCEFIRPTLKLSKIKDKLQITCETNIDAVYYYYKELLSPSGGLYLSSEPSGQLILVNK